jgi:hypothetical protein
VSLLRIKATVCQIGFVWLAGRRQTTAGRIDRSVKVSSFRRSGDDPQMGLAQVLSSVYGDVLAIG